MNFCRTRFAPRSQNGACDFNFEYYHLLIRFDSKSTVNPEIILSGTTTYDNLVICSGHKILVKYTIQERKSHCNFIS